jgi:hypothetical protein
MRTTAQDFISVSPVRNQLTILHDYAEDEPVRRSL